MSPEPSVCVCVSVSVFVSVSVSVSVSVCFCGYPLSVGFMGKPTGKHFFGVQP